jgi:hypothetical protein
MDKEAFLRQLECSIANKDKRMFIETVFDLPADVIVGFTQEEFSHVLNISRQIDIHDVEDLFSFLLSEGAFYQKNVKNGIDELNNSLLSRFYYSLFISLSGNDKQKLKYALITNSLVCLKLSALGVDSRENLETVIRFSIDARRIFSKTSIDYAVALVNEGSARQSLAEMGIDSKKNFENSICLYGYARKIFSKTSVEYAGVLMNEGNARARLAEMGISIKKNLENAVYLYEGAREIIYNTNTKYDLTEYALVLMSEGNVRQSLADIGIDSRKNLEIAISLQREAQRLFSKTSSHYSLALVNEGSTRQSLADMGVDSRKNLENAVCLYEASRKILLKKSSDYALSLMNESSARIKLADMGVDSRKNLETAIIISKNAQGIYSKKSAYYALTLVNEVSARERLEEIDTNDRENFEKSKKLYLESISILEELEDGWTYSSTLLKFFSFLKNNFYKTGDKKHLEEWERNLGDIEEKIKDRDIRYKELLMARIHEIRASLLELDGKQGIYDASFEYYEAYKLSKEPFYKFMIEFCQARSDNKSFCKIVSDWKEGEKKGIFLDYYDYTVFECHLENALKKSIFRKDELELARQKLEEIGSRTQIKIIKDRVSSYVFLINSLEFCFEQGSYEDAAEDVRKAWKIFHDYDDKPGCEMCECFHEALLENQNPESWRNIAQKIFLSGEFSFNFYRLLCNYSDRKRTNILQDLPLQILEKISRIDEKVDNIQKTLDQISADCVSIKDQIRNGFKGTDAELKKINEKIDNIEQDLENLVRISNDIDGKEGECIRKFASQMLELMKKGDYEALKRFSEKIVQNGSSFEEIIEAAEIPEKEKAEAKSKLADLKKIHGILKEKAKSVSVGVTENVIANLISGEIVDGEAIKIVSFVSGEIIKLLIPVLSTAIFGVSIPSKVVNILLEAMKSS